MTNIIKIGLIIAGLWAHAEPVEQLAVEVLTDHLAGRSCEEVLLSFFPPEGTIPPNLPYRDLKLSPGAADYARASGAHAELVDALARVLTAFPSDLVGQLGPTLRGAPDVPTDALEQAEANAFLKDHRADIDQTVLENLTLLNRILPERSMRSYDRGLLALLMKNVVRSPGATARPELGLTDVWRSRMRTVLERPFFRSAVHVLARIPAVRDRFLKSWNEKVPSRPMTDAQLMVITADNHRGKVSDADIAIVTHLVRSFVQQLVASSTTASVIDQAARFDTIGREAMFVEADLYLPGQDVPSHLTTLIIDVLDLLYFGSRIPTEANQVYNGMITEAKRLLLPLKAEYAAKCTAEDRAQQVTAACVTTPVEFRWVDFCERSKPCALRSPKRAPAVERAAPVAPPVVADVAPPDPARALDRMAMYTGEAGLPLIANEPYEFIFKRDDIKTTQRVTFKPEVVQRFLAEPDVGRRFLIAFERGRTRAQLQNGLKRLRPRFARQAWRAYEIKTSGSYRAIVTIEDGVWTVHAIVTKNDIPRTLAHL